MPKTAQCRTLHDASDFQQKAAVILLGKWRNGRSRQDHQHQPQPPGNVYRDSWTPRLLSKPVFSMSPGLSCSPNTTVGFGTRDCRNPADLPRISRVRARVTLLPCHSKQRIAHPRYLNLRLPTLRPACPQCITRPHTPMTRRVTRHALTQPHVSHLVGPVFHPQPPHICARHGWLCPTRTASDTCVGPILTEIGPIFNRHADRYIDTGRIWTRLTGRVGNIRCRVMQSCLPRPVRLPQVHELHEIVFRFLNLLRSVIALSSLCPEA